jgi:hypothetical protein
MKLQAFFPQMKSADSSVKNCRRWRSELQILLCCCKPADLSFIHERVIEKEIKPCPDGLSVYSSVFTKVAWTTFCWPILLNKPESTRLMKANLEKMTMDRCQVEVAVNGLLIYSHRSHTLVQPTGTYVVRSTNWSACNFLLNLRPRSWSWMSEQDWIKYTRNQLPHFYSVKLSTQKRCSYKMGRAYRDTLSRKDTSRDQSYGDSK